jgi:ABC-2 type transport system permease protein
VAVDVRSRPHPSAAPHPPFLGRLYGFGSIFGKTLRDSRFGILAVAALIASIVFFGGAAMANTYGSPEARRDLASLSESVPPVLRGLYGNPVNVDTLGGFLSWHYGAYFALLIGLWSILALSSTLAGEARRGSLEFVATAPLSRRRVAIEKLAGHVVGLAVATVAIAATAWLTGQVFATLPEDEIEPGAAIAFAAGLGLRALAAGSVAFALGAFVGRGAGAGLAGSIMVAGYVLHSYRLVVPAFDTLANATWFSWTADHIPLAGRFDWASLALVAIVSAVLLGVGVEGFARRDVGVSGAFRAPGWPRVTLGLGGPLRRSFGELLPTALAWGIGLGLYGFVMAASSRALADELASMPQLAELVSDFIPGIDITTPAGYLQLAFVAFGFVLIGLAAATLVSTRSSDETAGRLELLLTTPLTRMRWAIASGIATWLAIVLVTALLAVAIAGGVIAAGGDPVEPALGTVTVALYGMALSSVGVAVAGLAGAAAAGPVVVALVIMTFVVDLLGPALELPDWLRQLALTTHMGEPMVGNWDAAGIVACLIVASGGLAIGAWGMHRRDVRG